MFEAALRRSFTVLTKAKNIHCTAPNFRILKPLAGSLVAFGLLTQGAVQARAGVAYGTINNFDTVNDTGVERHGLEIEIEDLHSADINFTLQ